MKESQAVTTTVKIYFEQKMQSVKEFQQIRNEISLILHGSLLSNVMSPLIVNDKTNKTKTYLKNVK